jgi:pyruvate-ferredoxin/flavodoxin oxidoreductase
VTWLTLDGNEAVARVAHAASEVIAIYPITPSSSMGELADEWSTQGRQNVWGDVPKVVEMQSEAGAAGALHGALSAGAMCTTFTASQGLLLMIPDMYKIAGELTPFVMHVAARTIATHALSIFGDHADAMACRQTGFALLCSGSVQEAQDLALIAHAATLETRVPFLHFFDGFRTSHEVSKIAVVPDETLRAMLEGPGIAAHRARALTPDNPTLRGTAHNPDTYFQAREAANPFYDACAGRVTVAMERFASLTGRHYRLFDYVGHPEAERVLVMMGSGAEAAHETIDWLLARGEKVGLVKVRLYRPFSVQAFIEALPKTVQAITVLDRTKEPGAVGDPLWLDVVAALVESRRLGLHTGRREPTVTAARYGLSSKEFTPAMAKAALDELKRPVPRGHVTLGIRDDVTHRSLAHDEAFDLEADDVVRAVFFGLGSDGTVGSNKNTIKIIGEGTDLFAQGYFVYDSRKSGSTTVSHLRFGPHPIRSTYLVREASFIGCHHPQFLERFDVVELARPGATLLLNAPWKPEEVWDHLPAEVQQVLLAKRIRLFVVDAYAVAEEVGLGKTLGTVMQACFFALSKVLPPGEAIERMRKAIEKSYGKRGEAVVKRNYAAVDLAVQRMTEVPLGNRISETRHRAAPLADLGRPPPRFVEVVTAALIAGHGDRLPVSAFPVDGTWPTGTAQWEKRSTALDLPKWDPAICIQCNKCAVICPHAALRTVVFDRAHLERAPAGFPSMVYKAKEHAGQAYAVQVAPDDCTGCGLCVAFCPAKDKSNPRHKAIDMTDAEDRKAVERERFAFLGTLPPVDRRTVHLDVKGSQLLEPLFEFSGACAGCGETPYIKLVSQLFGDRALVANATGCSSIYGGNLPTTPWRKDAQGRGPAWSNSLFEDNAEYGMGMRLAVDMQRDRARRLLESLAAGVGGELAFALLTAPQENETQIQEARARVAALRDKLRGLESSGARALESCADYLVKKSVWIVGGDGWAYDIGFGGLDHVLASGLDVNILVLDTEVYSNTGGQQSKSTPTGAAAKFAASGKEVPKKDLALLATTYGHVYVARVAMGARDKQTLDALLEAESWHGPSLVIAYSHCIAHGYDMVHGADQQRLAVDSGVWPLFRYDPRRAARGEPAVVLDSGTAPAKVRVADYMRNEGRFRVVELADPKRFERLARSAQDQADRRLSYYRQLAGIRLPAEGEAE